MSDYIREQFEIITRLPLISLDKIERSAVRLPHPKNNKLTDKTLLLDLDNTLVFVKTENLFDANEVGKNLRVESATYSDPRKEVLIKLKIIIRPFAIEMLNQLSNYYEIIVFTAANKQYGDAVMDVLDPEGRLFDYRLYRNNCIKNTNYFIKDLRILNRDIESLIIVDDVLVSFSSQLGNGVFITPFFGSGTDNELGALWVFLRQIASANDVRVPIAAKYNLLFFYKMFLMDQQN